MPGNFKEQLQNISTMQAVSNLGLLGLVFGGGIGGGIGGPAAPPVSTSPQPLPGATVPSGPAVATLIDAIAFVEDGNVIRAEDHNDLVAAVRLIARLLDTGQIAQEITVSVAPVLLPVVTKTAFDLDEGFARGPAGDPASIVGWMPLDLPDGHTIESVRLLGSYPGTQVVDWPVSLRRVEHGKEQDQTIISGNLKPTTTPLGAVFNQSFAFDPRGHSLAEAAELSLVDTGKFRYQLHTTVVGAKPSVDLKVFTVQVNCVRS
jgi:hypothetical protein